MRLGDLLGKTPRSKKSARPANRPVVWRPSLELLEDRVVPACPEGPDAFEPNNSIAAATVLGSEPVVTIRDANIDNPDDTDFYRITAHDSGKLVINVSFIHEEGDIDIRARDNDGTIIASSTGVTNDEQIVIPVVFQQRYYLEVFAVGLEDGESSGCYAAELENFAAPVPDFIDLDAPSDTGISDTDNITNDTTPRIIIEADLNEFAGEGIAILGPAQVAAEEDGAAVEVFVGGNSRGFATPIAGTGNTLYEFTFSPGQLAEGLNLVKAAVRMFDARFDDGAGERDPASGRTQLSEPLSLILDTTAPAISQPDLTDESDTGEFQNDNVTKDNTPDFKGTGEKQVTVRLLIDGIVVNEGQIGTDGSDGVPNNGQGAWLLNARLVAEGPHQATAQAEDEAGNVSNSSPLTFMIDVSGAIVSNILINGTEPINLLKPNDHPTPPVMSLVINMTDPPNRAAAILYNALNADVASDPDLYTLVGRRVGKVPVSNVFVTNHPPADGVPATASIELEFNEPLPDDEYTLTISENVVDVPGNLLDDNQDGGDFITRFTVDSRVEVGSVGEGSAMIDIDGNFVFDPENGHDQAYRIGLITDVVFAGNFAPAGAVSVSGFQKIAAYGQGVDGIFRFLFDFDHDGVSDLTNTSLDIAGMPFAGDWNAAHPGDEIGIFDGTTFYLDTNANNAIDAGDFSFSGTLRGFPIAGDFDGDGLDDIATWTANRFHFDLAFNGLNGNADVAPIDFGFPGVEERPVAGDFDIDGIDDIGLYLPGKNGSGNSQTSEYYILVSTGQAFVGSVNTLRHEFNPEPFGEDMYIAFGDPISQPLVGNFDPPGDLHHYRVLYVTHLYNDLLGRDPERAGLDYWVQRLESGESRASVARSIASSPEYFRITVRGLYQQYLHRNADPGGLNFFVSHLSNGGTVAQVSLMMVSSPEYSRDRTTQTFLSALYSDTLGRSITANEQSSYSSQMNNNTMSRSQVAAQVITGSEFMGRLVNGFYFDLLSRPAEEAGRNFYIHRYANGARDADIVAALIGSDEYLSRP